MIAAGGSATEVAALLYRRRAVTVLSYVAQFMIIPPHLRKSEYQQLARLFKTPFRCWANADWHRLKDWGGPQTTSILALCLASLMRSCRCTLPCWRECMGILEETAWAELPLVTIVSGYPDLEGGR
eukprot:4229675-Pyramimonas_sp.AAC.1